MMILPKEIAKLIAYSLRHAPEQLGLEPDPEGWVTLDDIAHGFDLHTPHDQLTPQSILQAIQQHNRGRFEVSDTRIRALTGHTAMEYKIALQPPQAAFLRLSPKDADLALERGIEPVKRRYTRVYQGVGEASAKGKVLLRIIQGDNPVIFYEYGDQLYVESVGPEFLEKVEDT